MFSKVGLRTGALRPVLIAQLKNSGIQCAAVRGASTINKHLENWEKANKTYYGPERDHENFPIKRLPETAPLSRLGFIPESFFQAFYEKTGVTGPYMLGISLTTYVLSKEIWVVEHGFSEFLAFWLAFYFLYRKVGDGLGTYLADSSKDFLKKNWDEPLEGNKVLAKQAIAEYEQCIKQEDGQKLLYDAKRENVQLQLEAVYRQRLAEVHQAVKKRLDYQADMETSKRSFEQRHMVNWIVRNVKASITPQQEKESINKCIADLKAIGARA